MNGLAGFRVLIIYLCVIPLAIVLGFALASPLQMTNFMFASAALIALTIPLWIKEHHMALVLVWNSVFIVPLLPGEMSLGVLVACISLGISILGRTLQKQRTFLWVPSVAWPLIALAVIALGTAAMTGGVGARVLGSSMFGGKRYLLLLGAIVGFFALTAHRIPRERVRFASQGFFLSGATAIGSDLIYLIGPGVYFLFILFPPQLAGMLAITQDDLGRSTGMAWTSTAVYSFMLVRYGIQGIFASPWRVVIFFGVVAAGLLGGFRSSILIFCLVFACQFYFERIYRTKLLPIALGVIGLVGICGIVFIQELPLSVQRSVSFLPIEVHPMAKRDAASTLDWRLQMWKVVAPDVPKYLLMGKGFNFSGTDLYLTQEAVKRGHYSAFEDTLITGNYHNGLLTILIPFGIWGFLAFSWFSVAAFRVLRRNCRFGRPEFRLVNTFLLSFFTARWLFYMIFYGQLELDLMLFSGAVGLSICINHGVRSEQDLINDLVEEVDEEQAASLELTTTPAMVEHAHRD